MAFKDPNQVWRDFVSDGIPSSGPHKPIKSEIRNWADRITGLTPRKYGCVCDGVTGPHL